MRYLTRAFAIGALKRGRQVEQFLDEALRLAEEGVGASPARWVNHGVAGEDYADLVRARRIGKVWRTA